MWPWPIDPKIYRHLPLTILHLCMKYESCTLKITRVIMSEPMCWQSSVLTLTFDLFMTKSSSHYPVSMYEVWKLYVENYASYCVRTKVLTKFSDLDLWRFFFNSKMYRHLLLTILHLCMKYENFTLKTTPVIMSEPKCLESSVSTLIFDLLIPKCISIFLSPFCIYSMYEIWKL